MKYGKIIKKKSTQLVFCDLSTPKTLKVLIEKDIQIVKENKKIKNKNYVTTY